MTKSGEHKHSKRASTYSALTGLSAGALAFGLSNSWGIAVATSFTVGGALDTINRSIRILASAIDRNTMAQVNPERIQPDTLDL